MFVEHRHDCQWLSATEEDGYVVCAHSLNCSRVVSAILGCVSSDPIIGSEDPANSTTSVSPGPRLKAVRE